MKVASFTIDHDRLKRGIYVSRRDNVGNDVVTTFDVRFKVPNTEPCMDTAAIHTLEHLLAVYLRGDERWADSIIYVGPMGCRTGMYIIFKGSLEPEDVLEPICSAVKFVMDFEGEVPGASPRDCGNYLDMNLNMAKYLAKRYLDNVLYGIDESRLIYPC